MKWNYLKISIAILVISCLFGECTKPDWNLKKLPTVNTNPIINISGNSAQTGGTIKNDGGSKIISEGVCWSLNPDPKVNDPNSSSIIFSKSNSTYFSLSLTDLQKNTKYYVRSWAINGTGLAYGNELFFITTDQLDVPLLKTIAPFNAQITSAQSGGIILDKKNTTIISCGVICDTVSYLWNDTVNGYHYQVLVTSSSISDSFINSITNLLPATKYYLKSFAINKYGVGYGNLDSFTSLSLAPTIPTVLLSSINNITTNSATSSSNITTDGRSGIISRGVCWSTNVYPTIANSKTTDGVGTGAFNSNLNGLASNTTYYVRAYAINSIGTAYSDQMSFTTKPILSLATISTNGISGVSATSAISGGNITSDGNSTVTVRGVCWNTSTSPTISLLTKTIDGTGTGNFSSNITGLIAGTTYYVRAYATNSIGTAYGNELSFITVALPTLTTTSVSGVGSTVASCGGNITNDGGGAITARGVCWSTSSGPTVLLTTKTSDGSGSGSFSSSMSGLSRGTIYYVRAYATNSAGTSYGNEISFQTKFGIGQNYGGGKIFYLDGTGYHGLIAAFTDQTGFSCYWDNGFTYHTGATSIAIGAGFANTNTIISYQGAGSYAAKIARTYTGGGYSDWYLPSENELNQLYLNKATIGGFNTGMYWSSSEDISNYALAMGQEFNFGISNHYSKSSTYGSVRAIRAF